MAAFLSQHSAALSSDAVLFAVSRSAQRTWHDRRSVPYRTPAATVRSLRRCLRLALRDLVRLDLDRGMQRIALVERTACVGAANDEFYRAMAGDIFSVRSAVFLLSGECQTSRLLAQHAAEHTPTREFAAVLGLVDRFLIWHGVGPPLRFAFPVLSEGADGECWSLAEATLAAFMMAAERHWNEARQHYDRARTIASALGRRTPAWMTALLDQLCLAEPAPGWRSTKPRRPIPPESRPDLTARERVVLELIGIGRSNKSIAREHGITPETVKTHVRNLFIKLGVNTRTEAYATATRLGLISTLHVARERQGTCSARLLEVTASDAP